MLRDVVMDTCVLVHANNASDPKHEDARLFLLALVGVPTEVQVDPGIKWPPTDSTSKVWCEYRDSGVFDYGSVAHQVMVALMRADRVCELKPAAFRRSQIRPYTGPNLDAVFVQLAAASAEKRLITHDGGFQEREIRNRFGVVVLTCAACQADLEMRCA